MHRSSSFYGHRQILAEYCGEDPNRPLPMFLQHGTTLGNPIMEQGRLVSWLRSRLLVWGAADERRAKEFGYDGALAIGAPFLYLRDMLGVPSQPAEPSTIFYPYHSTEKSTVEGSHGTLVETVLERETAPVTACLYWVEFENPEIRRFYEQAGMRVVCHGRREDPGFLRRQFDEMSRHNRVITNRICTAAFYGGALEREVEVYGNFFARSGQHESALQAQNNAYPALAEGALSPSSALRLGNEILGEDHRLSPGDLRKACGWQDANHHEIRTPLVRAEHLVRAGGFAALGRLRNRS